jgi:acetylornithine deacetylase/succinyl-diaminopimelate desuccinylase-like protein
MPWIPAAGISRAAGQSGEPESMAGRQLDVARLAQDLIAIDSVSQRSKAVLSDLLESVLKRDAFDVERLKFAVANGQREVGPVAKNGSGSGGLAFFSHSDTVPGTNWSRDQWSPTIEDGRLIALGSCDMKGPLAATIVAASGADVDRHKRPVIVIITADEETTAEGTRQVAEESVLLRTQGRPMPHDRSDEVIDLIAARARRPGFDVSSVVFPPFHISPDAEIV